MNEIEIKFLHRVNGKDVPFILRLDPVTRLSTFLGPDLAAMQQQQAPAAADGSIITKHGAILRPEADGSRTLVGFTPRGQKLMRFLDPSWPCDIPGCEELRARMAAEQAQSVEEGCTDCQLGQINQKYLDEFEELLKSLKLI